ncbi:MAG: hypothetical protein NT149_04205 [Candidatus Gottesmanbacteria bacterium]|nr:hypothetical protein [Candidatus Gottesmanbacteria bacterium]
MVTVTAQKPVSLEDRKTVVESAWKILSEESKDISQGVSRWGTDKLDEIKSIAAGEINPLVPPVLIEREARTRLKATIASVANKGKEAGSEDDKKLLDLIRWSMRFDIVAENQALIKERAR